jgi:hypothetical protein
VNTLLSCEEYKLNENKTHICTEINISENTHLRQCLNEDFPLNLKGSDDDM